MSQPLLQQLTIGEATVSLCTLGTLRVDLAAWLPIAAAAPLPAFAADFAGPVSLPVVCAHIALPTTALVVDCCYPPAILHTTYATPTYQPPPSMPEQLREAGIDPDAVEHVVLTHSHFDHICGIVTPTDGGDLLTFPRARHYLGQADWEQIRGNLANPASFESRTLGLVERSGLLRRVAERHELAPGVTLIPAPGETPGHQIVRIASLGATLYLLGDLYHHPAEVVYPWWSVHWADGAANEQSRNTLAAAALDEGALLVASHIAGVGRLGLTASGVVWERVAE